MVKTSKTTFYIFNILYMSFSLLVMTLVRQQLKFDMVSVEDAPFHKRNENKQYSNHNSVL